MRTNTLTRARGSDRGASIQAIWRCVLGMEQRGLGIDIEHCRTSAALAHVERTEVLGELRETAPDAVWTSPVQLARLLHDRTSMGGLGIAPSPIWFKGRVKRGEVKTDKTALAYLAAHNPEYRQIINNVLRLRKLDNSLKYLEKLPKHVHPQSGRVHPAYGPAGDSDDRVGAVTGRLAAKNPEIQQIPASDRFHVKRAFVPAPGCSLIEVDYAALEMVILAHLLLELFGDTQLLETITAKDPATGKPIDVHGINALRVFRDVLKRPGLEGVGPNDFKTHPDPTIRKLRDAIKTIGYGLNYGKGAYSFGHTLLDNEGNAIGEEAATELVEGYLAAIPGIARFRDWVRWYIKKNRGIPSLSGRWCDLAELVAGDDWQFERAWRKALNFPMQASGADIIGCAMTSLDSDAMLLKLGWRMVGQVHDSVILEGPQEHVGKELTARVTEIMIGCYPRLRVPLGVSINAGQSLEETK